MTETRSPREVFLALVNGAALRSRDELRKRMESLAARPRQRRRVGNVTIHQTTDPEVIVAEFPAQTSPAT